MMYCGILEATHKTVQTVQAEGIVTFDVVPISGGMSMSNNIAHIPNKGLYEIELYMDITPLATGSVTVNILNNDTVIASSTFGGTAATAEPFSLGKLLPINTSCPVVDNAGNVSIQMMQTGNIENAILVIKKVR